MSNESKEVAVEHKSPMTMAEIVDDEEGLPVVQDESINMLAIIEKAACNPDVDVQKMSALLDMQERIIDKQAASEFNTDFLAMVEHMPIITKNGSVAFEDKDTKKMVEAYKFATYANINKAVKPIMRKWGFAISYTSKPKEGGGAAIIGKLRHKGGHIEEIEVPVALDTSGGKNNVQAMGSTMTYGKRYVLCAALDIVIDDDDDAKTADPIDEIELDHLQKLIDETETSATKICKFAGDVKSLPEIQKGRYKEVMDTLMERQKEQRKEAKDDSS